MKVSIITIVYNRAYCIEDCLKSVYNQTYSDIEHIVIDGNSTDGTQEIINRSTFQPAVFISEPDAGVFDAYNKGIMKATGDIIGVLNSDDLFYDRDVIRKVVDAFRFSGTDLVYGKGMFVEQHDTSQVRRIYPSKMFRKRYLSYGWIPLHTTIFVCRQLFEQYGLYNKGYTIASDYEISLRWFNNDEIKKFFLDEWIVTMRLGGLSTSPSLQLRKSREDLSIIRTYKLKGYFTLFCKIARKIPQYLAPRFRNYSLPERQENLKI